MKKMSLTNKLLAVTLAFVLVAVSLPDYLSFAEQPAQSVGNTAVEAEVVEQQSEQQVMVHLQAAQEHLQEHPQVLPMGTVGTISMEAQNTAEAPADLSIQLTQEEMAAYQAAGQDGSLSLEVQGDSLTFTLQPGEQVKGTLNFLYPNGYSSRETVEIAQEDVSIALQPQQELPGEGTGGTPAETLPPVNGDQLPEQTPPTGETQLPEEESAQPPEDDKEESAEQQPVAPSESVREEARGEPSEEQQQEPEETLPGDPVDPSDGDEATQTLPAAEQEMEPESGAVSLTQDYQTGPAEEQEPGNEGSSQPDAGDNNIEEDGSQPDAGDNNSDEGGSQPDAGDNNIEENGGEFIVEENGEQEQLPQQVTFDIVGATLTFTASFDWGELALTAQQQEEEQKTQQPDLRYTVEAASLNRANTGTIYTHSWSLQQVISLPQGASFAEGEAVVEGNQIRIGEAPVLSVSDQSGTAGELSAQRDGDTLLVTYSKTLSDWQDLEAERISDLGLAMTLHQEAIVRDESFTEGQVDVSATFTAQAVTAAAAPAAEAATLDTGTDEEQDEPQSVTRQGSLSLPLSGEPQSEQPQSGDADEVTVTYEGEPIYTENDELAVRYTITVTNHNPADPETPSEGEQEGSDGAVTVKIVQKLNEWFGGIAAQEPSEPAGIWDEGTKTLTWDSIEIEAGESWTKTVTVLIDTDQITGLDALPTDLTSSVSVYDVPSSEPEGELIAEVTAEAIDLKAFAGSDIKPVEGAAKTLTQNVYWRDNNDLSGRPESPQDYAGEVGLQFYIGDTEPADDSGWITLTAETMGQLGLTAETLPQVTTDSAHGNALWALTAQVPAKIQYGSGTAEALRADVHWRMVPPQSGPSGYYLYPTEDGWYYLKQQPVTFQIAFRDAVYDKDITADQVKRLITEYFALHYQAGADPDQVADWSGIAWEVKGSNGSYTLTLDSAVYYTIHNEIVHYYLREREKQGGQISDEQLDQLGWPGEEGQADDWYVIEYDNIASPDVGTVTDKVYSGGTLVLTRQGTITYDATKVWLAPEDAAKPEGYFELYRYTYPSGSYQTAAPVHGVDTVSFDKVGEGGKIIFASTDGSPLKLPKYDNEGNRYVYLMKEVVTNAEGAAHYEQIFGTVNPDGTTGGDTPPPIREEGTDWEREPADNYVYNGGTITNRIDEKASVSATKEWDASSFQAGLGEVQVELTLYGKPADDHTARWEVVLGEGGKPKTLTLDGFSAVSSTLSGSLSVDVYDAQGQKMEYRFFETAVIQGENRQEISVEDDERVPGAEIAAKEFTLTYEGNEVAFLSQQPKDAEIEAGHARIVNTIQDKISYTIDKVWDGIEPQEVQFALYQQGQSQTNVYVGTVTLNGEVDTEGRPVGKLTVGTGENQETYEVTYQVTEGGYTQLVIEGLPRYDEHGYSYEYIIVEMPDLHFMADYETTIDGDGNYTTVVTNAPGEGPRIMVRKRWIDNSDVQHREPVTITAYYADGNDYTDDTAIGSVTLGAPVEGTGQTGAWYDYISLQIDGIEGFDLNKVYIRETAIGNHTDVDTKGDLELGGDGGRVDNQITDRIAATNHDYEVTYSIVTLSPDQGGDAAAAQTFYVATNRRLGSIDMTVTKSWKDGGALRGALKEAGIVPIVKLDFADSSSAEGGRIDYDGGTVQLVEEAVLITGQDHTKATGAIQMLPLDEDTSTLYFFNLPKYDKDGRVANYTVKELWTTKANIEDGKVKDPDLCYALEDFLEGQATIEENLKELLSDLSMTVTQESYTENDGNHINDTQQIAMTNRLSGAKTIEFHKQWNDVYAFESGKRPDLYLTLYRWNGTELKAIYSDFRWEKNTVVDGSGEGGQEEPGGVQTQDQNNYYWTCIFSDLPKYDDAGNEIFYYAVEHLAVDDPSTFHYADPAFSYGGSQLEVAYEEGGTVTLPDENVDEETGQQILRQTGKEIALLENGTFHNNLEQSITINGIKLWDKLPLTASQVDLPDVTFKVYQYSSDENGGLAENGKLVAQLEVTSEKWKNPPPDGPITASGNQYTFAINEMNVEPYTGPLPLYDENGKRYTYKLVEALGKEGDRVDWNLVYHNETFNEYQITNSYDPQLGALSVKKLLEIPTVDGQQYYPAVTMDLYRALPGTDGSYSLENAELVPDKRQVWSSEEVKKAVSQTPTHPIEPPQPIVVEKAFTFEDLPKYAPNGQEYQYFVVEVLEDTLYYDAAVVQEDASDIEKVFTDGSVTPQTGKGLPTPQAIPLTPTTQFDEGKNEQLEIEPENGIPVSATFGDRYIKGDAITLQLTKIWEDQNDALDLRPGVDEFKDSLTVSRYANAQGGDGGAGGIDSEDITTSVTIDVQVDDQNSNQYIVTITGKEETPLAQYAPNGMPWIYKVTEENTGKDWAVYITTPSSKQVSKSADEATMGEDGNQVLDLGELKNSLMTSHSFQKKWQNEDGEPITNDYLGLGDITITGQLWVGEKGGKMEPASEFFGDSWNGWFTGAYWGEGDGQEIKTNGFQIDLATQLGNNDAKETISNLPRVNSDRTELVYAIVETEIKVTNPAYTQTFTWEWGDGKLIVETKKPENGLFTPQPVTVGENSSTTTAVNKLKTTDLSVEKRWAGDENETDLRPDSIDVLVERQVRDEQTGELLRSSWMAPRAMDDGWEIVEDSLTGKVLTLTLHADNGWKASISNLPSYGIQDGGLVTYDYRIRELKSDWEKDGKLSDDEILDANEKYDGHYTVSLYSEDGRTVTNTLTHMDITAVKAWKPGTLTGENAKVTFELQRRTEGTEEWSKVEIEGQENPVLLDGQTDEIEKTAWTVTWTELPRTAADGSTIEYRVQETLADGLGDEQVAILCPEEAITGSTANKTYTVTNIPLGQLTVTKKDGDGKGLAGVVFQLIDDSGLSTPRVGTTSDNGEVTFDKLPLYDEQTGEPITYTLTESSTPDGYIRLEQPIAVSFTAETNPEGGVYWETDDGFLLHAVEYEVVNGQYFPVVYTGGSGFYWPGVLGAGAAAAGVLYLIRRKTKGHHTEQ